MLIYFSNIFTYIYQIASNKHIFKCIQAPVPYSSFDGLTLGISISTFPKAMAMSTAAGCKKDFVCLEKDVSVVPSLNYTHGTSLQTSRATTDELVKREQVGQSWSAVHLLLQG